MAVLGATSLTGCNSIPAFIAAGTVAIFRQTAAPSSWTKDTTNNNNRALRCVTGTAASGGNIAFTTAFASKPVSGNVASNASTNVSVAVGNHTLATSRIPSHAHPNGASGNLTNNATQPSGGGLQYVQSQNTGGSGGSQAHSHPGSGNASTTVSSSFSGTAIDLTVQYVDVIQCTKD